MASLPTPGGSDGTYGTELNEFLEVSLVASDGKIKDGAEQSTSAAPTEDAQLANVKYVDDQNDAQTSGLIKAHCTVSSAGALQTGSFNVSGSVKDSTGTYTITWNTPFANTNYVVVGNAFGGTSGVFDGVSKATGSCVVRMKQIGGTGNRDIKFDLMAIGTQ